jgi:hypothetical protein
MPLTYSPSLRLTLIGNGEQAGVWGTTTNTNLGTLLEQAITGVQTVTMADADVTLTNLNGTSDQARNAVLVVGGANTAVRDIIAPLANKIYIIVNNTTGGYGIRIRGATGTAVSIGAGVTTSVFCDGANFYTAFSGTGASAGGVVYENKQTLSVNYTMTSGSNGESVGPITISGGITVTIPTGSRWVVL